MLFQLPVTFVPTIALALSVGGRTYHATFARGGAAATFTFACHEGDGAATQIGRVDARYERFGRDPDGALHLRADDGGIDLGGSTCA